MRFRFEANKIFPFDHERSSRWRTRFVQRHPSFEDAVIEDGMRIDGRHGLPSKFHGIDGRIYDKPWRGVCRKKQLCPRIDTRRR